MQADNDFILKKSLTCCFYCVKLELVKMGDTRWLMISVILYIHYFDELYRFIFKI